MKSVQVEIIGFGQIGQMLFRKWADGRLIRVTRVADPVFAGRKAVEVAGAADVPDIIIDSAPIPGAEIAVVTTSSELEEVLPVLEKCIDLGMSALTTCEEFFFDRSDPVRFLAEKAEKAELAVAGCGINPGFLMDFLPAVLSGCSMNIRSVTVERYQDASGRRNRFRKKIGAGLTMDAFQKEVQSGKLRHVGIVQSMNFLAAMLGWDLKELSEEISPVSDDGVHVRGVRQTGTGKKEDGCEVIRLDFLAAVGEKNPRDRIVIDGEPRIESVIPGGIHGDTGTCAVVTNLVRRLAASPLTGVVTLRDLVLFPGNGC